MRRRGRWVAAVVGLLGVTAGGVAYSSDDAEPALDDRGDTASYTARISRGDLVVTETLDGALGYGDATTVTSREAGTITWLPAEGSVIGRGGRLLEVDRRAVFLMIGRLPAYRSLAVGSVGPDVRQLERNLAALGFDDGLEIDDTFTAYTAAMVREWQEENGLEETGVVELGRVLFLPDRVRVTQHDSTVGDGTGPNQPVVTVSELRRVVTVDLPVAQRPLAREGAAVRVTLPDGKTVRGRVTSVGTVAETDADESQGGEGSATFEVEVELTRPETARGLDAAPVKVTFESQRRRDVLSVPVNSLVAIPGGGYAVRVVESERVRTVKVGLGVFADGQVEISAASDDLLREGMEVEVPAP